MLTPKNFAIGVSFIAAVIFLYDWITQFIPPAYFLGGLFAVFYVWIAYDGIKRENRDAKREAERLAREAEHRAQVDAKVGRILAISEAVLTTQIKVLPKDDPLREDLKKLLVADNNESTAVQQEPG